MHDDMMCKDDRPVGRHLSGLSRWQPEMARNCFWANSRDRFAGIWRLDHALATRAAGR